MSTQEYKRNMIEKLREDTGGFSGQNSASDVYVYSERIS